MKKTRIVFLSSLLLFSMGITSCGKKSETKSSQTSTSSSSSAPIEEDPDGYVDVLPENNQGNILQAFCWTFSDIKDNLSGIANSGFKAVQTSPIQQPKSGGPSWMSFYQPVSFAIATNSPLGTKQELKELCDEAEKYGIAIICDIVFNHMANIADGVLEEDGTPVVSAEVGKYEPYIYEHRNDETNPTFHHNKSAQGCGAITQYYAYGDLPDLNTANPYVQERSLSLLKECIDVGVDGFRFDAAKHIETPNDSSYASDFWPNVLGVAKTYYHEKTGKDLLAYGEVLNDVGDGRTLADYTQYMKVTDNGYISDIASASVKGDATKAAAAQYSKKTDASNLITWVESHDTYVEASNHISNKKAARQYAIISSRKGSNAMFLARPNNTAEVGVIADYFFENEEVALANRFHNRFVGCEEEQVAQGSVYLNERYSDTQVGAMLVNLKGAGEVDVTFSHLGTGIYYDQKTGEKVEVINNAVKVTFDDTGIIVLTKSKHNPHPLISISQRNVSFADSMKITLTPSNITECYYQINGGSKVNFDSKTDVSLGSVVDENNMIYVDIYLKNAEFSIERHIHFRKVGLIPGYFNVVNLKASYLDDYEIYYWAWGGGSNGTWLHDYTIQDGVLLIDFSAKSYTAFLLAIFEKDYVVPKIDEWDNNLIKQTGDINISAGFYDATSF